MNAVEILDDGLVGLKGHHYGYNASICSILTDSGFTVRVWTNIHSRDVNIPRANCVSILTHYCYDTNAALDSNELARTLWEYKVIFNQGNSDTIFFFPNFRLHNAVALRNLVNSDTRYRLKIIILLRYSEDLDADRNSLFIDTLKLLTQTCNIRIVTDTIALAAKIEELGLTSVLIGFPLNISPSTEFEDIHYDFTFMGSASHTKGFFDFLNAVALGNQLGFTPRVACQTTNLHPNLLDSFKSNDHLMNVIWIGESLISEDYFNVIARSDVMVLPYDVIALNSNSSGILLESLYMKKRILTTKTKFATELFKSDDADFLLDRKPETIVRAMHALFLAKFIPKSLVNAWREARLRSSDQRVIHPFVFDS